MLFRPSMGMNASISEAMAHCVEVDGMAGLIAHLEATHPPFGPPFDAAEIEVIGDYGDDDRIGWKDIHIIRMGPWGIVGFTNGDPRSGHT